MTFPYKQISKETEASGFRALLASTLVLRYIHAVWLAITERHTASRKALRQLAADSANPLRQIFGILESAVGVPFLDDSRGGHRTQAFDRCQLINANLIDVDRERVADRYDAEQDASEKFLDIRRSLD